jgi:osmoprotectant transport system permease protein
VAVDEVDRDVTQAARGMGMREHDVLFRVELPLSLPLIFAGIRTAAVYVVSTATIAAIAGGGGLGDIIVNQASYRFEGVLGAAYCVAALALLADFAIGGVQRVLSPRGIRRRPAYEPDVTTGPALGH